MTLQSSGAITLQQIIAEFGLASNAVFPTAFYGKGGAPASGPLGFHDFYGRSNTTISVPAGTYEHIVFSGTATCTVSFNRNGTCSVSSGVSPSAGSWQTPTGTTVGDAYDISFNGGSTWSQLNAARSISVSKSVGIGTTQATYDVRIRRRSDSVQVAAGSITLMASRDG